MSIKIRKMFFIDGFNLYHSIKRASEKDIRFIDCKWLDLSKMCSFYIDTANEQLTGIKYFTALSWKLTSKPKQQTYINALVSHCKNVDIFYGKFKARDKQCPLCHRRYTSHEEKLTDVNLAISLLQNAYDNTFDEAIVVSADSDLSAPIITIKNIFKEKCIAILPPIGNPAIELITIASKRYRMKGKTLLRSLLPASISTIKKPTKWESKNYIFDSTSKKYIFSPTNAAAQRKGQLELMV
jgi:uncharacterized LabA/DUF88 family protein